ncbi:hypothetical protein HRbin25_00645 [bacterium HR25]|nr:hypothetical protein HRbin25_00645 [bacterium HR25]
MTRGVAQEAALQELLDRQAIYDCLVRYCRGIDRCDAELVRSVYHPDAYDDHGPFFRGSGYEFADKVVGMLQRYKCTTHFIGNHRVELDGDVAYAETYVIAYHRFQRRDGREYDFVFAGRYIDRFERRDGEWKIAHRVVTHDWNRIDPVGETWDPRDMTPGLRSREDAVYRR